MKKSNSANTLLSSLPTSPTISTQNLAVSKTSLNSNNSNSTNSTNTTNGTHKTHRTTTYVSPAQSFSMKAKKTDIEFESILEKAKFYTSVCLGSPSHPSQRWKPRTIFNIYDGATFANASDGTTAILSVFTFLFLIPFVVDPAISTIIADYDPVPVTCIVIDHVYAEGIKNCTWSSCREGCTSSPNKCHQLYVNYTRIPFEEWQKSPRNLQTVNWDVSFTKFLINSEGCGYPPTTNCSVFAKQYGYSHIGEPFACYYSRAYPEVVIGRYSWENNLFHLILSLIIPTVLLAISIGVLSYWYCPCCDNACTRSTRVYAEKFPTKEEIANCMKCNPDKTISLNSY